jgi:hypothetical protein
MGKPLFKSAPRFNLASFIAHVDLQQKLQKENAASSSQPV